MTLELDPARYARAREVFHAAQELETSQREAFVRGACGEDPELERAALELLAATAGPDPLPRPESLRAELLREDPHEELPPPERIGPYRILGRIGAGGMGQVFEAEQDQPRRRVALKLIWPEWVSPRRARRFDDEIELLGRLRHENIARIYDSGEVETPQGAVRYFVMERVEGRTLSDWVAAERPSVEARLRVVLGTCSGVAEAHRRGIIHRDLKPQNVLVEADGTPKVLDFGIARLTSGEANWSDTRTRAGELVGTPQYMSPEQASGEADRIDTRTDVYSLGVVLFELLAGCLPHADSTSAGSGTPHASRSQPPLPPERLSRVAPALRGDLETIAARALAPLPADRYASVDALASDLRAFLEHRPIAARPPGLLRRLQLYARRQRRTFAILSGATLLALTAVFLVARFALRAEHARQQAVEATIAAEFEAYRAGVAAASAALESGDTSSARRYLAETDPARRGWEWSHLEQRVDESQLVLRGHGNQVWDVAFDPAGERLFSVGGALVEAPFDQSICAWDAATGERLWRRDDLPTEQLSVAVHPSGQYLVTGGGAEDPMLRTWRTGDGAPLHAIGGHAGRVEDLAFTEDGGLLVSAGGDGSVRLWHATRHGLIAAQRVLVRGEERFFDLALAEDFLFATGPTVGTLVFDRDGWVGLRRLDQGGTALAVQRDGGRLAIGDREGLVSLLAWNPRDASNPGGAPEVRVLERFEHRQRISGLAFTRDETQLIATSHEQRVRIWDVARGTLTRSLSGHGQRVHGLALDPSGTRLATGGHDRSVRLWDLTEHHLEPVRPDLTHAHVRGLDVAEGGTLLALTLFQGEVQIRRSADDMLVRAWTVDSERVHDVALDERRGRVAHDLGTDVQVRRLTGDAAPVLLEGHSGTILDLDIESSSGRLASASADGTVRVWSGEPWRSTAVLPHHERDLAADAALLSAPGWVWSIAWSGDGRLASGGSEGSVRIWALDADSGPAGTEEVALLGAPGPVMDLVWAPDATRLYSAHGDGGVRAWDPAGGAPLAVLERHGRTVLALAMSPDGTRLAATGEERGVVVWDPVRGVDLASLERPSSPPWRLAWSADGSTLYLAHQRGLDTYRSRGKGR